VKNFDSARSRFAALVAAAFISGCAGGTPVQSNPAPATRPTAVAATPVVAPADQLPASLSSAEFWKLQAELSEPGGYFQIEDNYTSNEMEVGWIYGMLRAQKKSGGVYLGVGPEQNFTYIAAVRPRMAFIVDIRRQAAMQHLMFKAVFELAKDRGDFVSLLFAKPRPAGITEATPIQDLWRAYSTVASDSAAWRRNFARVVDHLTKTHGFTFTEDESAKLKAVFDAFYYYGPSITTRGGQAGGRGNQGDFATLTGWSVDDANSPRSFLATEDDYRFVKTLHEKNLIVPITGDFGGPKAIRAIGAYLQPRNATVTAFYVSNVEQYLFRPDATKAYAFYENVRALPIDTGTVFIRPYALRRNVGNPLCPMRRFLTAASEGRVTSDPVATQCAF
jgi:hypothetical protein